MADDTVYTILYIILYLYYIYFICTVYTSSIYMRTVYTVEVPFCTIFAPPKKKKKGSFTDSIKIDRNVGLNIFIRVIFWQRRELFIIGRKHFEILRSNFFQFLGWNGRLENLARRWRPLEVPFQTPPQTTWTRILQLFASVSKSIKMYNHLSVL